MPSEGNGTELAARALAAVAPRVQAFRAAVASAREVVSRYQVLGRGGKALETEWALIELGPFAIGRIDPDRFARLTTGVATPSLDALHAMDRAAAVLAAFSNGAELHRVSVEPGADLHEAVRDALARVGRVFGAARVVELARAGAYEEERHAHLLGGMRHRAWNRAERRLGPPIVVEVKGEDCAAAGLGEFLDGGVCIVLVASGTTTPAPLARLITPGTFVMQTTDPGELARLAASPHPGVALVFDAARDGQALFVHDPDAGPVPWSRLEVRHLPRMPDVGRGGRAPAGPEELRHLESLAERPTGAAAPEAPDAADQPEPGAPADKLAAWLLAQSGLGSA